MSRVSYGPWEQGTTHPECGFVIAEERTWWSPFFKPVCPKCGAPNRGYVGIFDSVILRRRYRGMFRKRDGFEFKEEVSP
jgi:hypothetical protein